MVELQENTFSETKPGRGEKIPLSRKYDIPDYCLDFDYVEKCTDGKKLERILKILRSGEEGYYPQLTKAVEDRLTKIKPSSKLLRTSEPVLLKTDMEKDELNSLTNDLNDWLEVVNKNDKELESLKSKSITEDNMPKVRRKKEKMLENTEKRPESKRIASTDYAAWDKYDPDVELIKMDVNETVQNNELKKKTKEKDKKSVRFSGFQSQAELTTQANREREKGNEFFKSGDYQEALHYYTNSISCKSTAAAYTNRALTFIKLKKFNDAISDCEMALKIEPNNIKALLRMAQSLEAQKQYEKALIYTDKVITIDPNNTVAQQLANSLRTNCGIVAKNTRLKIEDVEKENSHTTERKTDPDIKVVEVKTDNKISKSGNGKLSKGKENMQHSRKSYKYQEIVPIPGTSKMSPPYFEEVKSNNKEEFEKKKWKISNSTIGPLFTTTIDINSDDECLFGLKTSSTLKEDIPPSVSNHNLYYSVNKESFSSRKRPLKKKSSLKNSCNGNSELSRLISRNNETSTKEPKQNISSNKNERNNGVFEENFNVQANLVPRISKIHTQTNAFNSTPVQGRESINDPCCHGEPYITTDIIPEQSELYRPFNFFKIWTSDGKDSTYKRKAEILRNFDVERLPEVIGNKLDSKMFSEIINCLFIHFTVPAEINNLQKILMSLPRIPRFNIIYLFLSETDRKYLTHMVQFLDQHGHSLPPEFKKAYLS